jgi:aminoglycoside phosphotransferase (APT) family kinase protein
MIPLLRRPSRLFDSMAAMTAETVALAATAATAVTAAAAAVPCAASSTPAVLMQLARIDAKVLNARLGSC